MPELTRLQETHAEYRNYPWADLPQRQAVVRQVIQDQLSLNGTDRYDELLPHWRELVGIRKTMCAIVRTLRDEDDYDNARNLLQELNDGLPRNYRTRNNLRRWISRRLADATEVIAGCRCCSTPGLQDDMQGNSNNEWFCTHCIETNDEVTITRDTDEPFMRDECYAVYESRYEAINQEPAFWVAARRWLVRNNYISTDEYGWVNDEAYSELREEGDISDPDDYDEDSDPEPPTSPRENQIISYHQSRRWVGHLPGFYDEAQPRLLMGLELEIEVDDEDNCNSCAYSVREQLNGVDSYEPGVYCWTERDGSLDRGFEVVTGYCGLDVHEEHLLQLTRTSGMRSHDTTTCGLHVHLDRSNITALHATKLVQFIHSESPLIKAMARRKSNTYCVVGCKKNAAKAVVDRRRASFGARCNNISVIDAVCGSRYEAINFETEGRRTLEFRLFRGTLYVPTIMATLEFTRISYLFTRDAALDQVNDAAFLLYIQRPEHRLETRYLRQYLLKRGYAVTCHANECTVPLAHQLERRFAA